MSNEPPPLTREALPGFLAQYEGQNHLEGWAELWRRGDCLPWDRGFPNPALEDILTQQRTLLGGPLVEGDGAAAGAADVAGSETGMLPPWRKKALVPGCGRGVDVLLLASFGYDAYGLEYSPGAIEACRQEEVQARNENKYPVRDDKVGRGSVTWIQGDFFSNDWLVGLGIPRDRFDLIYDYTFFCALDPVLRPRWAARHGELLAVPPRGTLICLEFPRHKDPSKPGPPYAAPSEAYLEHLHHPGQEIPYDADGRIRTDPARGPSEVGFERIAYWTPARTHAPGIGENGEIHDRVSLWRLRK